MSYSFDESWSRMTGGAMSPNQQWQEHKMAKHHTPTSAKPPTKFN